MSENSHKINSLLDKLSLDSLLLIEEHIQTKLNIENAMCGGESHLAKARYIMGVNCVSSLQLPTENSPDFEANVKVYTDEGSDNFEIRHAENDAATINPLRWFGVLVPQNLNLAQNMFSQALQWAVKAVNIQRQLRENLDWICKLRKYAEEKNY